MHEFLPQVSQLHHDRLAFRSCVSCRISMQFDNVSMMGFLSYLEYSFELKFLHLKAINCGQNMLEKAVYSLPYANKYRNKTNKVPTSFVFEFENQA